MSKGSWEDDAEVLRRRAESGLCCASREVEEGLFLNRVSLWDIRCMGDGVKRAGKEASSSSWIGEASGELSIGVELLRKPRAGGIEEDCDVRFLGKTWAEASGLLPLLLSEVCEGVRPMVFCERFIFEPEGDRRGDGCLLKYGLLEVDDGKLAWSSFFANVLVAGAGSALSGVCCNACILTGAGPGDSDLVTTFARVSLMLSTSG